MDTSSARWWACPLDVEGLAVDVVDRVRDAAAALSRARDLDLRVATSSALVAASFAAHEHLRIDGDAVEAWADLSGFARAADGWVRLHGNYPHHASVLRSVYGIRDRAGLDRALAGRRAAEIEEEVTAAGGIAVRVRSEEEWRAHPHHIATAADPWSTVVDRGPRPSLPALIGTGRTGSGSAGPGPAGPGLAGTGSDGPASWRSGDRPLPLDGVRVLDLTRVIAGPTASQLLACLGAEVLRIDPPHRPEILAQHLSTGMGKRSTILDLRDRDGRRRALDLAAGADVILTGYRPGALDRHGLGAEHLEHLAPQAVIGLLSAWGEDGPWGSRPGFDSIVQAATGIAAVCGSDGRPGALPVQALDHSSGHLLAALVLDALADARARTLRVSLLGAACALLALPRPVDADEGASTSPSATPREPLEIPRRPVTSAGLRLEAVPPPLLLDGRTVEQDVPGYGAAEPVWRRGAAG